MTEENKRKREEDGIKEVNFQKLVKLVSAIGHGIDLMHYLIQHGREKAYVVALISAEGVDLRHIIKLQKRSTDILFDVDPEKNLYAILCQGTRVDGGYHFIQRLVQALQGHDATEIYCSELEVSNTQHPLQELAFRLLNMYQHNKREKRNGEINFRSLK